MKLNTIKTILVLVPVSLIGLVFFMKYKNSCPTSYSKLDAAQSAAVELSGEWIFDLYDLPPSSGKATFALSLKQDKNSLMGKFIPKIDKTVGMENAAKIVRGDFQGGKLNFLLLIETSPLLECKSEAFLSATEISGTCKFNTGRGFLNQPDRVWRAEKVG